MCRKRMGTRLRNLRKTMKSVMLPGEKKPGVHGAGRLSDKNINLLQNYYGMATRQNNDNIYQMKKGHRCYLISLLRYKGFS